MNKKTVIVVGSRTLENRELVYGFLDRLSPDLVIRGVDKGTADLVRQWARERGVFCMTFKGSIMSMLDANPDATVLAFPLDDDPWDTLHCMQEALNRKMVVVDGAARLNNEH